MTETLEQIALRIARDMPEFLWEEGCPHESGVVKSEVVEFAKRLVEALNAQEPVAWADNSAIHGRVGNCASAAAKEYWERSGWADRAMAERLKNPLYAAPKLGEVK